MTVIQHFSGCIHIYPTRAGHDDIYTQPRPEEALIGIILYQAFPPLYLVIHV